MARYRKYSVTANMNLTWSVKAKNAEDAEEYVQKKIKLPKNVEIDTFEIEHIEEE